VHLSNGLLIRSFDKAKDAALILIQPIGNCFAKKMILELHIQQMSFGNLPRCYSWGNMEIHVDRHTLWT
jgi:hypothetical protein